MGEEERSCVDTCGCLLVLWMSVQAACPSGGLRGCSNGPTGLGANGVHRKGRSGGKRALERGNQGESGITLSTYHMPPCFRYLFLQKLISHNPSLLSFPLFLPSPLLQYQGAVWAVPLVLARPAHLGAYTVR